MLLEMQGIHKSFHSVTILRGVDFSLNSGEIHALVGENGAGKSTLMKLLCGVYPPDRGQITLEGRPITIQNSKAAQDHGIAMIHQELSLIPSLSVLDNFFLGREESRMGVLLRHKNQIRCLEYLAMLGASQIKPDALVNTLSMGEQQMVEIAKALSLNATVLIMDEPTAALTEHETQVLFSLVDHLKQQGVGIIYISHRIEEIFRLCDRISVLRDGQFIGERLSRQTNTDEIVHMMVGRKIGTHFPKRKPIYGPIRLKVDQLTRADGPIEDIHFEVRGGEILGIAGLMGSGRSMIFRTIFGLDEKKSGEVWLDGEKIEIFHPIDAIHAGIGFVTEDRKTKGLVLDLSLRENITLTHLERCARYGIINAQQEEKTVADLIKRLHIRASNTELHVRSLSGGNQQKVVFAKWLGIGPRVLFLDEPTRGVDVDGKSEIYLIINELADKGVAIVMISSDLPELLSMSNRILVMHQGHLAGTFNADTASQEIIMRAATGEPPCSPPTTNDSYKS